jgi:hypothetical protein
VGYGLSSPATQNYAAQLAGTLNLPLSNYAINGAQSCDIFPDEIYANSVQSGTDAAPLATLETGGVDAWRGGEGAYEVTFTACSRAAMAWLLTPTQYMALPGTAAVAATGACSASANATYFGGAYCSGAGTLTFTTPAVNTPFSGTAYGILYYSNDAASGSAGFTYTVNGGSASSLVTTKFATPMATQNGTTSSVGFLPITASAGAASVVITTTTGDIAIEGLMTVPPVGYYQHQVLGVNDLPTMSTVDYESVPIQLQYNSDIYANVAYFAALGFDARVVPTRNYLHSTAAELNSAETYHPTFPLGQGELAAAYKQTLQAIPNPSAAVVIPWSLTTAYVSGSGTTIGTTTPVTGAAGVGYSAIIPIAVGTTGPLSQFQLNMETADGTSTITIIEVSQSGSQYELVNSFTVTPHATGVQTFVAGTDYSATTATIGDFWGVFQPNAGATIGYNSATGTYEYISGLAPSSLTTWGGTGTGTLGAAFTVGSASYVPTSNVITPMPGITTASHCSSAPGNASAGSNVSSFFITLGSGQITINNAAVAGMVYTGSCTQD